jgi:hypothetical protein
MAMALEKVVAVEDGVGAELVGDEAAVDGTGGVLWVVTAGLPAFSLEHETPARRQAKTLTGTNSRSMTTAITSLSPCPRHGDERFSRDDNRRYPSPGSGALRA